MYCRSRSLAALGPMVNGAGAGARHGGDAASSFTEPRRHPEDEPASRSCFPLRLTSWKEKGMSWGSSEELTGLQTCIQNMVNKKLKLVNVVQVMLIRRILPCQQRAFNLWEFDPAQHRTLNRLFDTTHEDAWRVLFKSAEVPPPITEDCGFSAKRQAKAVSCFTSRGIFSFYRLTPCGI